MRQQAQSVDDDVGGGGLIRKPLGLIG